MDMIDEVVYRWNEMAASVVTVDLDKSCDAPCNDRFASNCVALCFLGPDSPFKEGSQLDSDWQDMMFFYRRWRDRDTHTDCAYKKRFVRFAQKIVEAHPLCPFVEAYDDESFEALQEQELREAEAEDVASETYVPVEKVVPDEPVRFFNIFKRKRGK